MVLPEAPQPLRSRGCPGKGIMTEPLIIQTIKYDHFKNALIFKCRIVAALTSRLIPDLHLRSKLEVYLLDMNVISVVLPFDKCRAFVGVPTCESPLLPQPLLGVFLQRQRCWKVSMKKQQPG